MPDISPDPRYPRKRIAVHGYEMACVDVGPDDGARGDPIVFLHGNATSSYMWRNIMPHLEGRGRLIALDNIGQGDSDRLRHSGPASYRLLQHQTFIDGALEALGVADNVTFVMHDWGGPLGITWARHHPDRVKGLAHCEILVANHASYDDYPDAVGAMLGRLRGPEGEALVLEQNFFVEKVFTAGVMRTLDDATMNEIRRPWREPGENRRATLSWPREIPIEGAPADVARITAENSAWMAANRISKLFVNVDPGQIVFESDLRIIRSWPNQTEITVRGLHHPQEDSPDAIGRGLAAWYETLG
jgi:haloalkane dehalogenase